MNRRKRQPMDSSRDDDDKNNFDTPQVPPAKKNFQG
jgi:hypothetical protein